MARWRPPARAGRELGTERQLILAHCDTLRAVLDTLTTPTHVILTAHSLPVSVVRRGDPYPTQVRACAEAVAEELGRPCGLAYQSQGADGGEWLGPISTMSYATPRPRVIEALRCPVGFLPTTSRRCTTSTSKPQALRDSWAWHFTGLRSQCASEPHQCHGKRRRTGALASIVLNRDEKELYGSMERKSSEDDQRHPRAHIQTAFDHHLGGIPRSCASAGDLGHEGAGRRRDCGRERQLRLVPSSVNASPASVGGCFRTSVQPPLSGDAQTGRVPQAVAGRQHGRRFFPTWCRHRSTKPIRRSPWSLRNGLRLDADRRPSWILRGSGRRVPDGFQHDRGCYVHLGPAGPGGSRAGLQARRGRVQARRLGGSDPCGLSRQHVRWSDHVEPDRQRVHGRPSG